MYLFSYGIVAMVLTFAFLPSDMPIGRAYWALLVGLVVGLLTWVGMPVMAWNFGSNWVLLLFVGAAIAAIAVTAGVEHSKLTFMPAITALVIIIGVMPLLSWSLIHSDRYRALLGEPTVSEFNADVSPVDINRIRRVDQKLAHTLGSKRIEELPGLGSRVDLDTMNIQMVNGCFDTIDGGNVERKLCFDHELVWVGPLIHEGVFKWWNNNTTPGYVIVSAVDSTRIFMVMGLRSTATTNTSVPTKMGAGAGKAGYTPLALRYLESGSYFGDRAERHVRLRGYYSTGLSDYTFEIDDTGRPYWAITMFEKKVGFSGEEATGTVIVDPQTGEVKEYSIAATPAWVDRIQPDDIVSDQINYWGKYIHGFWNSIFAARDVVKATPGMSLVYGADGRSYWYSGLQSAGSDTGTNSFMLVNTRTKEVRRYMISGANEKSAQASAENAPGAREANFKGTHPILYNVGGEPTYFLTLKGEDGLVKMYAFVSVRNYETVGIGRNTNDALRDYQNGLVRSGTLTKIDDVVSQLKLSVKVIDVSQIGDTFYIRVEGLSDQEYYGTNDVSPELKWARPGMAVEMVVNKGDNKSVPIIQFDIVNLGIAGK